MAHDTHLHAVVLLFGDIEVRCGRRDAEPDQHDACEADRRNLDSFVTVRLFWNVVFALSSVPDHGVHGESVDEQQHRHIRNKKRWMCNPVDRPRNRTFWRRKAVLGRIRSARTQYQRHQQQRPDERSFDWCRRGHAPKTGT